jgi:hypothetical protein
LKLGESPRYSHWCEIVILLEQLKLEGRQVGSTGHSRRSQLKPVESLASDHRGRER